MIRTQVDMTATPASKPDAKEQPNPQTQTTEQQTQQPAQTTQPTVERPAWLPENFKSPEDLLASYKELQRKQTELTQKQTPPAEDKTKDVKETPAAETPKETPENQSNPPKQDQFAKYGEEIAKTGKLSDESYADLAKAGFDRKTVDTYIAGQQAIVNQYRTEVFAAAGGEDALAKAVDWGNAALDPATKETFNKAINSGDLAQAKLAVENLMNRYQREFGSAPKLVEARPQNGSTVKPFASHQEMVAAMRDQKYGTDPAYREQVAQRIKASPNLF